MEPSMIRLLPLLEQQIKSLEKPRPTMIFPEGDDPRILSAASHLTSHGNIVLVTSQDRARQVIEEQGVELRGSMKRFLSAVRCIQPEEHPLLCDELHDAFMALSQGSRWAVPTDQAARLVREPVMFSCMAVHQGYADCVLGGAVHASREFFRPALRLLHTERKAFAAGLFSLPDSHPENIYRENIVVFADVAINVDPDPNTLAQIAVGSCKIVRDLIPVEVLPHINGAILSYSTRGSASGPSVERIREAGALIPSMLAKLAAQDPLYGSIHIEAELQISCAISMAAAQSKLQNALADPDSAVGRANVLILPSLDAGNLMYHLYATRYADADKVLMVGGMDARVLDYSRSSSAKDVTLGAAASLLRVKRKPDWNGTPRDRFFQKHRVLVVNPGSTSTRMAVYRGRQVELEREVSHSVAELEACGERLVGQLALRRDVVVQALAEAGIELSSVDAFVGRGGLVRPSVSGTYRVNEAMLEDLASGRYGEHASNLGAPIVHALARAQGKQAYIVDPVVTDELDEVARLTGLAGYERRAAWHALSQKAAARRYADEHLKDYEEENLIVAHLGGGITVGCHRHGRVSWVSNGLDEGPMTPERAGSMPATAVMELCLEHDDLRRVQRALVGHGGLVSHLGTADLREVEARVDGGDGYAALVFDKLCQDIAAWIASCVPRFEGQPIDGIILTGGMARSGRLVAQVEALLKQIPIEITVYPGAMEGTALRDGALRILDGQEQALEY
jgi:butyrate kinase